MVNPQPPGELEQMLPAKEVASRLATTVSTIYRMMERDGFPRPVAFTTRCVRWKSSEVAAWVEARREAVSDRRGPEATAAA